MDNFTNFLGIYALFILVEKIYPYLIILTEKSESHELIALKIWEHECCQRATSLLADEEDFY